MLELHSDDELAHLLDDGLVRRRRLHSWPLSCVEAIECESGARYVYKAQRSLPTEADFYEAAGAHPLLPGVKMQRREGACTYLVLQHLDRPHPAVPDDRLVPVAREIVTAISTLPGHLPCYVDIGDHDAWKTEVDRYLARLSTLIGDRRFTLSTADDVDFVASWSARPAVLDLIEGTSRLSNGDMKFEHVFVDDDQLRIVDWQMAAVAPADIDLVMLLENRGAPPLAHVAPEVVGVRWFLMLRWAVEAKWHLLPSVPQLFDQWANEAISTIRAAATAERHPS